MRRGSGVVTAAVLIVSMAAVRCSSSNPPEQLPVSPGEEETAAAPPQEQPPVSPPQEQPPASPPQEQDDPVEPPPLPGPPPLSGCAGLAVGTPAEPSGWTSELLPMDYSCGYGTTDGLGNVMVLADHDFHGHETLATVLAPDGTRLNTFEGYRFHPVGQRSGFIGYNIISYMPYWVTALSHTGTLIQQTAPDITDGPRQVEDPTGGILLLSRGVLTAYDATGNIRWSTTLPINSSLRAMGVDRQGQTLLLADGTERFGAGTLEGYWLDGQGQISAPFLAVQNPPARYGFVLYPQVGSGLFLLAAGYVDGKIRGQWIAAFASRQASSSPAPAWLASRRDTTLHMVHGGKGYAMLPFPQEGPEGCHSDIEVIAPSGESCGTVRFSSTSASCSRSQVWVGYDGTVIQSAPRTCDEVGHCSCSWKWWPGYFR